MYKLNLGCSIEPFSTQIYQDKTYEIIPLYDDFAKAIAEFKENGFNSIELSPMAGWNFEEEQKYLPLASDFLKVVKQSGIKLNSIHLPFALPFWDFSALEEEKRKFSVEHAKWAIDTFEKETPKYFVIHHGLRPKTDEDRKPMLEQLVKSLNELCEYTNATICIENMTGTGLLNQTSEALWLIERVPKLMMVIDTNHMFIEKPEEYIEKIGSRIKCLHISDRDEERERHWLPNEGVLNWKNIIEALEKVGYSGEFTYEIGIPKSKYTAQQIKENYEKLFEDYNALKQ